MCSPCKKSASLASRGDARLQKLTNMETHTSLREKYASAQDQMGTEQKTWDMLEAWGSGTKDVVVEREVGGDVLTTRQEKKQTKQKGPGGRRSSGVEKIGSAAKASSHSFEIAGENTGVGPDESTAEPDGEDGCEPDFAAILAFDKPALMGRQLRGAQTPGTFATGLP